MVGDGQRVCNQLPEALRVRAHQRIRIFTGRERRDPDVHREYVLVRDEPAPVDGGYQLAVACCGRNFDCVQRCLRSGLVRVQRQHDVLREALHELDLPFGDRRAHGCGHVPDAELVAADHVHVAFDDDQLVLVARRVARSVEAVHGAALVEERCLGCVQVFRLLLRLQRARAEPDQPPAHVTDGEHQPIPEAVVQASIPRDREPAAHQLLLREAARTEVVREPVPACGRVSDLPAIEGFAIESTGFDVGARRGAIRAGKRRLKEHGRRLVGGEQSLVLFALLLLARGRRPEFDPGAFGADAQRLGEFDILAAPHELDHVAACGAGTEAVPGAALRIDDERGRALLMEGAVRFPRTAALLQVRDIRPYGLDDVEPALYFIDHTHGLPV